MEDFLVLVSIQLDYEVRYGTLSANKRDHLCLYLNLAASAISCDQFSGFHGCPYRGSPRQT
jgi:hypothetical protein